MNEACKDAKELAKKQLEGFEKVQKEIEKIRAERHKEMNELKEKFPKIFSEKFGFQCQKGWKSILEEGCAVIQERIDFKGLPQVIAVQVKEKFGGLRFYHSNGDEYIHGVVEGMERMSYRTCEVCGNPGSLRRVRWWKTLCDEHHEEREREYEERNKS